jgi:hypothetical protein
MHFSFEVNFHFFSQELIEAQPVNLINTQDCSVSQIKALQIENSVLAIL